MSIIFGITTVRGKAEWPESRRKPAILRKRSEAIFYTKFPKTVKEKKEKEKKKVHRPSIHHCKHSKTIIRRPKLVCFLRKFLCPSNKSQDSYFIGVVTSLALRLEDHLESVLVIILILCSCISEQKEKPRG